ncbi:oligosaccharide flippase family protein [Phaeobacter piscinae]|uniref:oligosaccharide flippase family protein n=1 Tax=Phaeobacter piscinae TaxID=1580596 RepID=UPI00058C4009|nr:oligosaccharide flippase family protein [Phaeobacter piscinae]UTS82537.1 Teichuronic acid biosynthesis protein TuaB [Phaeobacter piscinae]
MHDSNTDASTLSHVSRGRGRLALLGVFWSFVNIMVSNGLTVVVFLVTSLLLEPADFGAVALATSIVIWVMTLVPLPLGDAIIQRSDLRQAHLDSAFWLTMAIALAAIAVLVFTAPLIASWTSLDVLAVILPVLSLRILFVSLGNIPAALVNRRMEFRHIALRTTLANGLGAAGCLLLVLQGYAIWALIMAQVITAVVGCVVSYWTADWRPGFQLSRAALRDLRGFTLFTMGGRMIEPTKINQILLGIVAGPAVLGIFFFARRICEILQELTIGTLLPVTRVLFASLQAEKDQRREAFILSSFAAATAAFPLFIGFIIVAPTAIPFVFGSKWLAAIYPLQCFAMLSLMMSIGVMQASLVRFSGHARWWFGFECVVSLTGFAAILLLAPGGLNPIMSALVGISFLLWPIATRKTLRILDMSVATYIFDSLRPALISVSMMAIALFTLRELGPPMYGTSQLLAQFAVAIPTYVAMILLVGGDRLHQIVSKIRSNRNNCAQ